MSDPITIPVRMTVDLAAEVAEALRVLAERKGLSIGQAVANAIATERFVLRQRDNGATFLIEEADGTRKRIIWP